MANLVMDFGRLGEAFDATRHGLGQGGLSSDPMITAHVESLKSLRVKHIRLFVLEYHDIYPDHGVFNWARLDESVDAILATGAKPFLCLCVMPAVLRKKNSALPNRWAEWEALIHEMVRHYNVKKKCGIEYWEFFNEPDLGGGGAFSAHLTTDEYCDWYRHTVRAIRKADPKAKVGGPAVGHPESPFLEALVKYCSNRKVPLDFVSWHKYTNDPREIGRSISDVRRLLDRFPNVKPETIINEWNYSYTTPVKTPYFQPCFVLDAIYQMLEAGLDKSCYYHIRNYFYNRDETAKYTPLKDVVSFETAVNFNFNYLGLFDFQGTVRPSYYIFKMLSFMIGRRVGISGMTERVKALATYDDTNGYFVGAVWNFPSAKPSVQPVTLMVKHPDHIKYRWLRFVLDCQTSSNDQNDRFKLVERELIEPGRTKTAVRFKLKPYEVTFAVMYKR